MEGMKVLLHMYRSPLHNFFLLSSALVALLFVSCDDGVDEGNLYTIKKEMLSEYLQNRPEFSEYTKVVNKAGRMNLLATYGRYTCFAPTNEAMQRFYKKNGYSGVDDMSQLDCDTLTLNSIVNDIFSTGDFKGKYSIDRTNMLGYTMSLDSKIELIGTDSVSSFCINRSGTIIYELANDSVENGIVHPVDEVIAWTNTTLPYVMRENTAISIFNECIEATGLINEMMKVKDQDYDSDYWINVKKMEGLRGARYYHIPKERLYGFTAFVVPDSILAQEYGIKKGTTASGISKGMIGLYKYACTVYPSGEGSDWYGNPDVSEENFTYEDFGDLESAKNPLHQLIAYHIMPRNVVYERLYTDCTICHLDINPTEWYSTLNEDKMFKLEYVYPTNKFLGSSKSYTIYLNRSYDPDRPQLTTRGSIVTPSLPDSLEQKGINGIYYYIDRLIDYGEETQNKVFNTRMRIDAYTMFPEAMNSNMRSLITWSRDFSSEDAVETNYIYPPGYFDNITWGEKDVFVYCAPRNWFGSFEGDSYTLQSNYSYDMTFRVPRVPAGQYQIRLMATLVDNGGMTQAYVDGQPYGMPFSMQSGDLEWKAINEWQDITKLEGEALQTAKKNLHNHDWYHGPLGFRYACDIIQNDKLLNHTNSEPYGCKYFHLRRVIYTGYLDPEVYHTIRLKSVMSYNGSSQSLDAIEIVPSSVYGIETDGVGEDDL